MGLREAIQMSGLFYGIGRAFVSLLIIFFSGDRKERKQIRKEGFAAESNGMLDILSMEGWNASSYFPQACRVRPRTS